MVRARDLRKSYPASGRREVVEAVRGIDLDVAAVGLVDAEDRTGDLAAAEASLRGAVPEGGWRLVGTGGQPADASGAASIRVDGADPALAARLAELKLGPAARSFSSCP